MRFLWLMVLVMPLAELYVLIAVGGRIGVLPTIAAVVLTGVLGLVALRVVVPVTLGRIRAVPGEVPVDEVIGGLLLVVGVLLLVIPGFITDALGLLLLLPPVRRALGLVVGRSLINRVRSWNAGAQSVGPHPVGPHPVGPQSAGPQSADPVVLEGDYEQVTDARPRSGGPPPGSDTTP